MSVDLGTQAPLSLPGFGTRFRALVATVLALAVLALPLIATGVRQPALVGLATQVLIYGLAAMSLNLVLGFGGMVSFGHAAFFGLGGYVAGILYQHFSDGSSFLGIVPGSNALLVVVPLAMLVSAAAAAIIGSISLRTSGVQFIMITLALAQMLYYLFVSLKTYGGDDGLMMRRRDTLPLIDTRNDASFYFVCLVLTAAWYALTACIVRSRFGFILAGLRQSERRLAASGIAPFRYKLVAFVISAIGTGLAGALLANDLRFVSPDMLYWTKSGELMMMVILGGVGTLTGPLLGAAALVILEACLTAQTENWQLFLGVFLLAVVLFTRGGLSGLARRISAGISAGISGQSA